MSRVNMGFPTRSFMWLFPWHLASSEPRSCLEKVAEGRKPSDLRLSEDSDGREDPELCQVSMGFILAGANHI